MVFNAFYAIKNIFGANIRCFLSCTNFAVDIGNLLKKIFTFE